jgi:hypothetical protein
MNLTRERFPLGWTPNADDYNGDHNGLLRMDNLKLDDEGALTITEGIRWLDNAAAPITAIYSKTIGDVKYRFISTENASIYKQYSNSAIEYLTGGGSPFRCTFAHGLGHVYMYSGNVRKKFDGTRLTDITPVKPENPPQIQEAARPDFMIYGMDESNFSLVEGSNFNPGGTDGIEFRTTASGGTIHKNLTVPENTMNMSDGSTGTPYDTFHMWLKFDNPDNVVEVNVFIYLDSQKDPLTDYYKFSWSSNFVNKGATDAWTHFTCIRHEFEKSSQSDDTSWERYYGIRLVVNTVSETKVTVLRNGILFAGSAEGTLNSYYEYIQVNVNNNGYYLAKSVASDPTPAIQVINNKVIVTPTPSSDSQVNEYWIYRRDATWRSDVIPIGGVRKLDKFYRVAVRTTADPFIDDVPDEDAILENVVYFEGFESIMLSPDEIRMSTNSLWNNRMVYITDKEVLFSDEFDPGLYSPIWNLKLSGSNTEKNLWIAATSMNQLLVGTTEDIYEITGTAALLPDGTLDVRVTPLGTGFPPIHETHVVYESSVIYVAEDGIRIVGGGNYKRISEPLDQLFNGIEKHGVSPVDLKLYNTGKYSLAVAKNKLYFSTKLTDGTTKVFVYDLKLNYWRLWTVGANILRGEEDGNLLLAINEQYVYGFYTIYTDPYNYNVELRTIWDHNGQPRNRKDVFTLKVTMDTGGANADIYISRDGESWVKVSTVGFAGKVERLFTIADKVPLGFRYALRIVCNTNRFKFYNFTIEYEPRPEQLTFYRLGGTNFGTYARKRLLALPIELDTLGTNSIIRPYLDGVAQNTLTVMSNGKRTHVYYFTEDKPFVDFDLEIDGNNGKFEFYGLAIKDAVMEQLPSPTKFLILPKTNFGTPQKKRIRTIPFQIDTLGNNVTFTPYLDGVAYPSATFNTGNFPRTVFYYFTTDAIGIDFYGILSSNYPFEFYKMETPEIVEIFPIYKKFDQVGPVELRRIGRIIGFRVNMIVYQEQVGYTIYSEDSVIQTGNIQTNYGTNEVYEIPYLPKTIKGTIIRLELGPLQDPWHRYWVELKYNPTGNDSQIEVMRL